MLAAFWIQFMTHDWFSHLEEGHNAAEYMKRRLRVAEGERRRDAAVACGRRAARLPPRRRDRPGVRRRHQRRRPVPRTATGSYWPARRRTFRNTNTAWWDASQIYGYDERSRARVKRDPKDPARLLMVAAARRAEPTATSRATCRRSSRPTR